jgi:hypothetical protein
MTRRHLSFLAVLVLGTGPVSGQSPASVARISGTVYDSVAGRHLSGAFVQLIEQNQPSRTRSATTDSAGVYAFDGVAPNSYLLSFFHPVLDSLAVDPPLFAVRIQEPGDVRAMLATPSKQTILARVCGDSVAAADRGLWLGVARSAVTGLAAAGARVALEWSEITASGTRINRESFAAEAIANAEGMFAICGLPASETMYARAVTATDSSGMVSFFTPPDGFVRQDLLVAPLTERAIVTSDSLGVDTVSVLSGPARLTGSVQRVTGDPIEGARVAVWGTAGQATTSSRGLFALDSLPMGTHTVEVRALGFVPVRRLVHVRDGSNTVERFQLDSRQTYLDTVKVVGQRVYESPMYREFLERKRRGFGTFLDEDYLEKRRSVFFVSDWLRMVPGVRVSATGGFGGSVVIRNGASHGYCAPNVIVDGMASLGGATNLEGLVNPQDIRGIEIYTHVASMPSQFQVNGACGAIVIWTGARRTRPADPEIKK